MSTYSIKDLEQLSGIKAHTLRMWEQRYSIIKPKRTPTNIRYYDDSDLRLLLNISFLNSNGFKISKIAKKTHEEIGALVMKIAESSLEFSNQIRALVIAMVNLDERRFEKIIATNTLQFGFENTMINMIYPFLQRIGILWQTGNINPAHEHFISNLVRQKIIVAIDGQITSGNPYAKKYLLFLPENELHELSLLFAAYVIKSRHNRVIYLGQNLPHEDLKSVNEVYEPDYMFTVLTSSLTKQEVPNYITTLCNDFPNTKLLLSGYQAIKHKEQLGASVQVFNQMNEFVEFVDGNSVKPFAMQ